VSDYNIAMFHEDYEIVIPIFMKFRDMESLDKKDNPPDPGQAVLEIAGYFKNKYGNFKGIDYHMRFLSVMQFIEHYRQDLLTQGLITDDGSAVQVPDDLLGTMLDSYQAPRPPQNYPSSSLLNQQHEFNFKKVVKKMKSAGKKETGGG
jgi:hypothetical protein